MATNNLSYDVEDYDGEHSKAEINPGGITALNYDAKHADFDTYKTALQGIILGKIRKLSVTENFTEDTAEVTDVNAQRERKWLVTYRDNQATLAVGVDNPGYGKLFSREVPTAKLSLLPSHSDKLILTTSGAIATYVAAFEAVNESPTGGADLEVVEIRHVGRNL